MSLFSTNTLWYVQCWRSDDNVLRSTGTLLHSGQSFVPADVSMEQARHTPKTRWRMR